MSRGFARAFEDIYMLDGVRTPFVDYVGAFGLISPTDLGIKVARSVLSRSGVAGADVGSVITGSVAQADFDAFFCRVTSASTRAFRSRCQRPCRNASAAPDSNWCVRLQIS